MTTNDLSCPPRHRQDKDEVEESDDEALEEEFMEMIIASERVPSLLDNVSDARLSRTRRRAALLELASLVTKRRSYASAAADEGAALLSGVTSFLKSASSSREGEDEHDEEAMEAAAAVLAAAGGDAASGGGDVDLFVVLPETLSSSLNGKTKKKKKKKMIRITQASLSDGLGTRLWAAAPALLAALDGTRTPWGGDVKSFHPSDSTTSSSSSSLPPPSAPPLAGASVLELGCGTGAGALAAVALGARSVSATDGEARVLEVARKGVFGTLCAWAREEEQEEEEAENPSFSFSSYSSLPQRRRRRSCCCWDDPGGKLVMRRLWWGDGEKKKFSPSSPLPECEASLSSSSPSSPAAAADAEGGLPASSPPQLCSACASAGPPRLDDDGGGTDNDDEKDEEESRSLFDVVLAADVLYDDTSAPSLAAEVASRLRREPSRRWVEETTARTKQDSLPPPRPAAFFACPVRESRFLDDLISCSNSRGLTITIARDDDAMDRARELGVKGAGKAGDYEGGFVFARLEWG